MPNRYAVASGNWSNPAIWDGGTLPTSADTVRPNGFTVTINQNITVLELFNNAATPAVAGGGFVLQDGFTINATTIRSFTGNLITYSGTTSATINSGILIGTNTSSGGTFTVLHNNTGTLTVNGNITDNSTVSNNCAGIVISGAGTLNFNGTANGGANTTAYNNTVDGIRVTNTLATVNIVGSLIGGQNLGGSNGNGNFNNALLVSVAATINITGTILGGTTVIGNTGLRISAEANVNVTGVIQASNFSNAIASTNTNLLIFNCQIINTDVMAIYSTKLKLVNTSSQTWQFNTQNALVTKTLYDVNTLPTIPTVNNVRNGVSYASGALTGTLVVPPANAVTAGVTYDNGTVGTAQNTAASFLTALAASSDPLAVRLKNVATVQTTGDQIAAAL